MKQLKQAIILLLTVIMFLTACEKNAPPNSSDEQNSSSICTEVRIVTPHNPDSELSNLAVRLQTALVEEWGKEVPIVTEAAGEGTKDVLFGITTREASSVAKSNLLDDADFLIDFSSEGGVIAGKNNYAWNLQCKRSSAHTEQETIPICRL